MKDPIEEKIQELILQFAGKDFTAKDARETFREAISFGQSIEREQLKELIDCFLIDENYINPTGRAINDMLDTLLQSLQTKHPTQ